MRDSDQHPTTNQPTMVVYVVFRRGNWLYRAAAEWLSPRPWLKWLCQTLVRDSWMSTALVYKHKNRVCLLSATSDNNGTHVSTDESCMFDKLEAYTLIALPGVLDERAAAFAREVSGTPFNAKGAMACGTPAWFARRHGVQADLSLAEAVGTFGNGLFCSELVATFVQRDTPYGGGAVPCDTTVQSLHHQLLARNPELVVQQFYLSKQPDSSNWVKRLE
jgi:hypothetical protein